MPGPRFDSKFGKTFFLTRTREYFKSSLCGSDQYSTPDSSQADSVVALEIFSSGLINLLFSTAIAANDLAPDPLAKPSKTLSA